MGLLSSVIISHTMRLKLKKAILVHLLCRRKEGWPWETSDISSMYHIYLSYLSCTSHISYLYIISYLLHLYLSYLRIIFTYYIYELHLGLSQQVLPFSTSLLSRRGLYYSLSYNTRAFLATRTCSTRNCASSYCSHTGTAYTVDHSSSRR
jgi:hypothetical protein